MNKLNLNQDKQANNLATAELGLKKQKNNQICTHLRFNLRFLLFDEIRVDFKFLEIEWYFSTVIFHPGDY